MLWERITVSIAKVMIIDEHGFASTSDRFCDLFDFYQVFAGIPVLKSQNTSRNYKLPVN